MGRRAAGVRHVRTSENWYSGRTIHIHFRVRTFDDSSATYDFTSQLFFDDAVSNQVLVQSPYDTRGTRDTTNMNDGIYRAPTQLTLTPEGSGYLGTFNVALDGLPATTGGGSTCADVTACRTAVTTALPDPTAASDKKSRKVAHRLARLNARAGTALDRAVSSSGRRQTRQYHRARKALERLLSAARAADETLGTSLTGLEAAVNALLALVPSA